MKEYNSLSKNIINNEVVVFRKISNNILVYAFDCNDSVHDLESYISNLDLSIYNNKPIIFFGACSAIESNYKYNIEILKILKNVYPLSDIIIIGCGVKYSKDDYPGFKYLYSDDDMIELIGGHDYSVNHSDGRVRVTDGCPYKCSFCSICNTRPKYYNVSYKDIKRQVDKHILNDNYHISLFGNQVSTYKDNETDMDLLDMAKQLLIDFPEITINFEMIDPRYKRILELIEFIRDNPRIDKDIVVSAESFSDNMLKLMNRGEYGVDLLCKIKEKAGNNMKLTFEVIVGHPGETEELFQETCNNIKKLMPVFISVECYFPRKNTSAYYMSNHINESKKQQRKKIINSISKIYYINDLIAYNQKFNSLKNKLKRIDADLYNKEEIIKIFNLLKDEKLKDVYIVNKYDFSQDWHTLNARIKFIETTFNIFVVNEIDITNNNIDEDFVKLAFETSTPLILNIIEPSTKENKDKYRWFFDIILKNKFFKTSLEAINEIKKYNDWYLKEIL